MLEQTIALADTAATERLGAALAARLVTRQGGVVTLHGTLGAGKTTLARAALRALGITGPIKSPTYTLVEPYEITRPQGPLRLLHMDLYRLTEPEELYGLGVFDEPPSSAWWLVEWPEKAGALLPPATLEIHLDAAGDGRIASLRALDADDLLDGAGRR